MEQSLRERIQQSRKAPKLRIERALILTQSHKQTEGEPMIIRSAKAFHELANKMPIVIEDWQLVVGNITSEPFTVSPNPETGWRAIVEEIDEYTTREAMKYLLSEEDKQTLKEVLPWWQGKSTEDAGLAIFPHEVREAFEARLLDATILARGSGSFAPNYEKVFSRGFSSIIEEIKGRISELDLADPYDFDKWLYWEATLIGCDAAIDYAKRYAELARKQAGEETREKRREELLLIAQNCERVPEYPVRNFFEALQAFWFIFVLVHFEAAGGVAIVAGRLDQLLYPYMKEISRSDIKKWLESLWINFNQVLLFLPGRVAHLEAGHPAVEQPTIAGVDENGEDASNELTEMMLEVERGVRLPLPDIAVMYHDKISKNILDQMYETLLVSMKPKFVNHDVAVKQALKRGMKREDIKDLVNIGCVTSAPQGKIWGKESMSYLNLSKALELALNDGTDPLTGKKVGLETGDPTEYESFDQMMDAFKRQLKHAIRMAVIMGNIIEKVHTDLNPQPFTSIVIDDCLERGIPLWKGGARYNIPAVNAIGFANVPDSLSALKKLVFEDRVISMAELLKALHSNFEGEWERLRQKLIHDAPKFGNDDDYVDGIAADVVAFFCEELGKFKCKRGPYYPTIHSVSSHVGLGEYVGALPDGRKAKQPLADGMSPAQGVCFKGPTAVIRSMTKIDHAAVSDGTLLNMKFNAATARNPLVKEKFIHLLETYMQLGGYHVQFNIVDTTTLKDAQAHPDKYPDLQVRVAAYPAQFTELPKGVQDDIIARSELSLA